MFNWINNLNLDVHTTIIIIIVGLIIIGTAMIVYGIRIMQYGSEITYVRKRQRITKQGLKIIAGAVVIAMVAFVCGLYGEPLIYQVYIPSATITLTPSITPSLTVTLTPTMTLTPTVTKTPSITPIPTIPGDVADLFTSDLEPNENIIFSPLKFSDEIDEYYQPIIEKISFEEPVDTVYGSFTYNNMIPGIQWTTVWVNPNREVICYETESWGNYTGGYGFTECEFDSSKWVEGEYQVQLFLGTVWWQTDTFWIGSVPVPTQDVEP